MKIQVESLKFSIFLWQVYGGSLEELRKEFEKTKANRKPQRLEPIRSAAKEDNCSPEEQDSRSSTEETGSEKDKVSSNYKNAMINVQDIVFRFNRECSVRVANLLRN